MASGRRQREAPSRGVAARPVCAAALCDTSEDGGVLPSGSGRVGNASAGAARVATEGY